MQSSGSSGAVAGVTHATWSPADSGRSNAKSDSVVPIVVVSSAWSASTLATGTPSTQAVTANPAFGSEVWIHPETVT